MISSPVEDCRTAPVLSNRRHQTKTTSSGVATSLQAVDTYALDAEMAAKLRKANPQAFQNVVRRMLEAAGRGLWNADPETIEKLRGIYTEMEDELEGVTI